MKEHIPMINLKIKRREKKLTQAELGRMIGVKPMTIYFYEQGLRSPDIVTLIKISKILNCKIDDLVEVKK